MQIIRTFGHVVGSTLLVAGTCIGLGFLTHPQTTVKAGFIPSFVLYLIAAIFMLGTSFLVLEACIWMPKGTNFMTLAQRLLGKGGKILTGALYILFYVSFLVVCIAGGGGSLTQFLGFPHLIALIVYTLIFSYTAYKSILWVDRLNICLMIGALIAFLFFILSLTPYTNPKVWMRSDWGEMGRALPLAFAAFGYQCLIPTLFSYLNRNVFKVKLVLVLGTLLPLLIYTILELTILGVIPSGYSSWSDFRYIHHPGILIAIKAFLFLAVTTSYLGVSTAFLDFLVDGFRLPKKRKSKIIPSIFLFPILLILAFLIPYPCIFLLKITAGFCATLLFGILPILMIWVGRYLQGYSLLHEQVLGGKAMLILMLLFCLAALTAHLGLLF